MKTPYRQTKQVGNQLKNLLERDRDNSGITQGVIDVFLSNPYDEHSKTEIAHQSGTAHSAIYDGGKEFLPDSKSRMDVLIDAGLVEKLDAEDFPQYRKDPYAVGNFEAYAEITEYLES